MAADSLTDPSTLTRALPAPTTSTLATLDAATLAPAELAAALRRRRQGGQHTARLRR